MRRESDGRIVLWPLHLARLRRGCAAVGFPLDEARLAPALAALPQGTVLRTRLAVDGAGGVAVTHAPLPANPPLWRVILSDLRLDRDDPWLRFKTSRRPVYDAARAALPPGLDEAMLMNAEGELCEGTITSLFLRRGGRLLTPPLRCGLLPGVLRASLLQAGAAVEALLRPEDLNEGDILCGNALRGLIPARLA
ncbi:aminotransferase class IV [Paracoccus gahaiensis]|uniref:Probable branched-chain-amino-acid aminotransferase n=2 Tax=Paracoccus gahaiensis TaxID=1706839 RepID=A0A4U0R962_9RHOB|nr:aminotransferase class IV [Paracoccus gahaiensis]